MKKSSSYGYFDHVQQDVWVSQYYEPNKLDYLPLKKSINGRNITFDLLKRVDIIRAFHLVQDGAKYEDNIGIDEFESISTFEEDLKYFQGFSLKENGRFVGSLFIGPNCMTRSLSPCLCQFQVFLNHELFHGGFYSEVVKIAERFARDLKLRFFVGSVLVFGTNVDIIRELRRVGYNQSACFPHCGLLKSSGYQETWLMTRQFDEYIELRHMADIMKVAETKYQVSPKLLQTDILPLSYYFRCGITARFRWIRVDELEMFHKMFQKAMKSGEGYGADEYLTYSMFLKYQVHNYYAMVIEDEKSRSLLGIATGGQHHRVRGPTPFLAGASVLIAPEHRGKGLSSELVTVWPCMLKHLGFKYLMGDTDITNSRVRHAEYKSGFVSTGVVPYGMYLAEEGWADTVLCIKDLTSLPDIHDVINASHERRKDDLRAQAQAGS